MRERDQFPRETIPRRISALVRDGVLEEMSVPDDPCPSFGTRLHDGDWLRLWVEHPTASLRKGWPRRFTVTVHEDPSLAAGKGHYLSTEDPEKAVGCVFFLIQERRFRFRPGTVRSRRAR